MRVEAARRFLARAEEAADEPVDLPSSILSKLTIDDVPDGVSIHVGTKKGNVLHMDWGGKVFRLYALMSRLTHGCTGPLLAISGCKIFKRNYAGNHEETGCL